MWCIGGEPTCDATCSCCPCPTFFFFLYECFVSVDFLFGRTQNVLTLLGSQASFVILSPALSIGS